MGGGGGQNLLDSPKTGDNSDIDDNDTKEDNEDYVVTIKTYDDYFTDLNITAQTITTDDLSGNGSEVNPYVVHSTKGFLWLTGYNYSKINLYSKHIKLACDVILNDEKFDQYDNISGGDGVVYKWEPLSNISGISKLNIDGNDNYICGMFCSSETSSSDGLFSSVTWSNIYDLNFKNCYIFGKSTLGIIIGQSIKNELYDCKVENSTIKGVGSGMRVGGLCGISSQTIYEKCFFDGVISDGGQAVGGILGWADHSNSFRYCKNYGKISSQHMVGGIIGESIGRTNVISNCENYGEIYSVKNSVGGLAGSAYYSLQILNSVNYAKVCSDSSAGGGFIGNLYTLNNSIIAEVKINGCVNYGEIIGKSENAGFVGGKYQDSIIEIKNCANYGKARYSFLGGYIKDPTTVDIRDCINYGESNAMTYDLTEDAFVNCVDVFNKKFIGNEFSNFYLDYKTGKIGLKCFSGKGFYQMTLDKEFLISKGFSR